MDWIPGAGRWQEGVEMKGQINKSGKFNNSLYSGNGREKRSTPNYDKVDLFKNTELIMTCSSCSSDSPNSLITRKSLEWVLYTNSLMQLTRLFMLERILVCLLLLFISPTNSAFVYSWNTPFHPSYLAITSSRKSI
jgi:hypothetical protein